MKVCDVDIKKKNVINHYGFNQENVDKKYKEIK